MGCADGGGRASAQHAGSRIAATSGPVARRRGCGGLTLQCRSRRRSRFFPLGGTDRWEQGVSAASRLEAIIVFVRRQLFLRIDDNYFSWPGDLIVAEQTSEKATLFFTRSAASGPTSQTSAAERFRSRATLFSTSEMTRRCRSSCR